MLIDVRTMLVVLAATSMLMALMLWLAFPGSRDGLGKWALALVLQGCAWALFAARGLSSDLITIVVGNLLYSTGVALKIVSLLQFQRRRAPAWLPMVLPVSVAGLFLMLLNDPLRQALLNGLAYAAAFAVIAWLMWRPPHTTSQRIRWLMIITYATAATGFLARGILGFSQSDLLPDPLAPSALQTFSHVIGYMLVISSATGILLMHKERADEATRQLAAIDPLTGVYNRRIFIELADMALARAQRMHTPLSLLMLDLDHFKGINDRHGHLVGDEVLKSFVRLVQTCLRREDLMVRFGGEEFCILLPDAALEGALSLAERIRALVEETPMDVNSHAIRITVSFGVDSVRAGEPGSVGMLLERADAALYRAKQAGRNRIASYVPLPD
jgi:diguanylate cyclase (GGDEF)-like protein